MRTVMPVLQKAKPVKLAGEGLSFASVSLPKQLRETKIVKDKSADDIAKEIVEWIKKIKTGRDGMLPSPILGTPTRRPSQ